MRYTKEQRLDIGRRIYNGELTKYEAAKQYDISHSTARDYMKMYRDENRLPPKRGSLLFKEKNLIRQRTEPEPYNIEVYKSMSKDELIQELIKVRIADARLKKGYEVKGDGSVIRYSSKNTK